MSLGHGTFVACWLLVVFVVYWYGCSVVQVEVWSRWSVDHHRWSLVGLDGINEIILATVHRWLERVHVGGASVGHLFCPWFFGGGVQLLSSTSEFFQNRETEKTALLADCWD